MKHTKRILAVLLAVLIGCLCMAPAFAEGEFDPATCTHEWRWAISEAPTCGTSGTKYEYCIICDANGVRTTRNEGTEIPPEGEHSLIWVIDENPTCGAQGKEHQYCTVCHGTFNVDTPIQATGEHTFVWVVDVEATCGTAGLKHRECKNCGTWETEEQTAIPHTGVHTWEWETVTAPTCGRQGVKRQFCPVCRAHNINTYQNEGTLIAATGEHNWVAVNDERNRASTCTREGTQVYRCSACGNEKADAIDKAPHVDANGDDKCDNCGVYMGSGTGVSLKSVYNRILDFFWEIWLRISGLFTGKYF